MRLWYAQSKKFRATHGSTLNEQKVVERKSLLSVALQRRIQPLALQQEYWLPVNHIDDQNQPLECAYVSKR